jgi:CheY-like chemotaxis protein
MTQRRRHLLAIEDDPPSLALLREYLRDEYEVVAVDRARAGLAHLETGQPVDAILLDRMMPELDGLAFMREARSRGLLRNVPVVMQSAAVTEREITEGIASGVFYYLAKPFTRAVLHAVLSNALEIHEAYRHSSAELSDLHRSLRSIDRCELTFRRFGEIDQVANLLIQLYPEPSAVTLGVRELLINAIEHGNAGITYVEKTALQQAGTWHEEIERRLALPENRAKRVAVAFERGSRELTLTIEDAGRGFDWRRYLALDPLRIADNHGRGIALALLTSFDRIRYVEPGNKVICTKLLA